MTNYVWEEVFILCVLFLTVDILRVFLGKSIGKLCNQFIVISALWLDNAHVEFCWDTESKHAFYEDPHDFQVH